MITVRRLNMDSSWHIQWENTAFLIDPWLIGSEIDGFAWFNEQWHQTPPVSIDQLDPYNYIVISQPFDDHCNLNTLTQIPKAPIYATPKAHKKLKRALPNHQLSAIATFRDSNWLKMGELQIAYLKPDFKLAAVFAGIVIKKGKKAIVYCPHGFELNAQQAKLLKNLEIELLLTSFTYFKLPFFLGGVVNPGKKNAIRLIEQLQPQYVMHTHDELKPAKGLVTKIATTKYLSPSDLEKELSPNFIYLGADYKAFRF